jgi:rSAM/selenodomain-associated transferase 2
MSTATFNIAGVKASNPASSSARPRLSVIVPTLNESENIAAALEAILRIPCQLEVIVVDGGSEDGTAARAAALGARVITAPCRGSQLHAGASVASGDVLWFVHADTLVPQEACEKIAEAISTPAVIGGNFEIRFDGELVAARFLTWLYRYLACFGLRYGDSAYFVRRDAYERAGGFRAIPLFEDLDLLRRLRRQGSFVRVPATVVTSSRRFAGRSFAITFARWTFLQLLYWLGVSPVFLGKLYRHIRTPGRSCKMDPSKSAEIAAHQRSAAD